MPVKELVPVGMGPGGGPVVVGPGGGGPGAVGGGGLCVWLRVLVACVVGLHAAFTQCAPSFFAFHGTVRPVAVVGC